MRARFVQTDDGFVRQGRRGPRALEWKEGADRGPPSFSFGESSNQAAEHGFPIRFPEAWSASSESFRGGARSGDLDPASNSSHQPTASAANSDRIRPVKIASEAGAEGAELLMVMACLGLAYGLALIGIASVFALRARQRDAVGTELQRNFVDRRPRMLQAALAAALLLALTIPAESRAGLLHMLPLILLAGTFHLIRPDSRDQICGDRGLRLGWTVLSFDEFESWRLMGEHLRYQKFGLWEAVALAPEHHTQVRTILERDVADRESAFNQ